MKRTFEYNGEEHTAEYRRASPAFNAAIAKRARMEEGWDAGAVVKSVDGEKFRAIDDPFLAAMAFETAYHELAQIMLTDEEG